MTKTIHTIQILAKQVNDVFNVHDIVVHSYGAHRFISLHIEIAEGMSPENMHNIADSVEKLLSEKMEADVVTHVDPITLEGEEIAVVKEIITKNLSQCSLPPTFQDLRIVKNRKMESILFQVPLPMGYNGQKEFRKKCSKELKNKYPDCHIIIEFKSQMTTR